ncbi:MAG TPA: terminase family protein [Vitreimonas sp.]|uniref:DNA-packaging protein n=1 Tax=Vitreimonas sp. TaxID=3069702 RepID=UPI002D4A2C87|nr:terminase family protein [Vitreimonas sp.]HYD89536.1 terminase family protein [Vitreimonas sp.]
MKQRTWRTQLAHNERNLAYIAARFGVPLHTARAAVRTLRTTPNPQSAAALWRSIAHAAQLPPQTPWATWLFQGGRGAGKTRAGAEWLAERAESAPGGVFALIGATHRDVREVMIDGVSGLRALTHRPMPRYEASRQRLVWPNGAIAYCFSAQEPERLRGPQFDAAWADEFCVWPKPADTLSNLRLALRRGPNPQLVVTTTPKPLASLKRLRAEPGCITTLAPTTENAAHLSPAFLAHVRALYGGTRLEAQELEGLIVENESALFSAAQFARLRAAPPARFDRIVVAVDPPAGRTGSACGIVVAGSVLGGGGSVLANPEHPEPSTQPRAYILEDASAHGLSPLGWASRVADAARRWNATCIVAEANQGGEMVRTVLSQANPPCPVNLVHASEGKRARAEPIALLYEQERIFHCAGLAPLEEELLALGADANAENTDRADAAIWALSDLMLTRRLEPRIRLL